MILTPSELIGQLDKVAGEVAANRKRLEEAKAAVSARVVNLNDIPNRYADMIETLSAVDYGGDAFEDQNKAQYAALVDEFTLLVGEAIEARDWLNANITEF